MHGSQRSISGKTQALIQRAIAGLGGHAVRTVRPASRATQRPVPGSATPGGAQRMHFEALEPRLLMSADILPMPQPAAPTQAAPSAALLNLAQSAMLSLDVPQSLPPEQTAAETSASWVVTPDVSDFSSPLKALNPSGSFVHAGGVSGAIDTEFGTDTLTLDVQGGQAVALRLRNPDAGLEARLEVWQDLAGTATLLGAVDAGQPGDALALQVASLATGPLQILVSGLAGTGTYEVELFLGATLEESDSSSPGDALSLDALLSPLPGGNGSRASVIGSLALGGGIAPVLTDRFDNGVDLERWSFSTWGSAFWGQTNDGGPGGDALYSGAYDGNSEGNSEGNSTLNLTSAVLRVDLGTGGTDGLQLQFDLGGSDTEQEYFSGNAFFGDEYADGVAISVDNNLWVPVTDVVPGYSGGSTGHHRLDLGAALQRWELQAEGTLYIKFLHANTPFEVGTDELGNPVYGTGDRTWDNVVVDRQTGARWVSPVSVTGQGPVIGNLDRTIDGVTPAASADASDPYNGTLLFPFGGAALDFDLGSEQRLLDVSLSIAAGAGYRLETSVDGLAWTHLLTLDASLFPESSGLQRLSTASSEPDFIDGLGFNPTQARYLRLTLDEGGESFGGVGELAVRTGTQTTFDGEDWYQLTLAEGESASLAAVRDAGSGRGTLSLAVYDEAGNLQTFDDAAGNDFSVAIASFRAAASGVYQVHVTGEFTGDYHLAVTRNALLGGAQAGAVDLTPVPTATTHVGSGSGTSNGVIRVAVHGDNGVVSSMLNDANRDTFSAVAVSGSDIDTLAELSAYDVVVLGSDNVQHEFESFAGALRSWVEAGGGVVATGWTVYGGGLATGNVVTDLDAVVPVQLTSYYDVLYSTPVIFNGNGHPVVEGINNYTPAYSEYSPAGADVGATTLATANSRPVVVVSETQGGRGVYLGQTYFYIVDASAGSPDDRLLEQAVAWAGGDASRSFSVRAEAGDALEFSLTPNGEAGAAPVNDAVLDLTLVDAAGNALASANGTSLAYTPLVAGTYTLVVHASAGAGDLVVQVSGSTAAPDTPLQVLSSSLDNTVATTFFPDVVDLHFDAPLLLSSLDADDLRFNGVAASAVTWLDNSTARFQLTQLDARPADGSYLVELAAGSVRDAAGRLAAGWSHSFRLDTTLPVVTAVSLATGATTDGQPRTVQVAFSEAMNPQNLGSEDVELRNLDTDRTVALTSFSLDDGARGVQIGLPSLPEGNYRLTLRANSVAFRDLVNLQLDGGPSSPLPSGDGVPDDFRLDFRVDLQPQPLGELPGLGTPGSLVYGKTVTGDLVPADTDAFTVQLDAGQVLSVLANPQVAGGNLRFSLQLLNSQGLTVAEAIGTTGSGALLQTLGAGSGGLAAGLYTLQVVGLEGTGGYALTAVLGAAVETEAVAGGTANDDLGQAQDLGPVFSTIGSTGERAAVIGLRTNGGGAETGADLFRLALAEGQSATAAVAWSTLGGSGTLALDLLAADGSLLASSEAGVGGGAVRQIADFRATVAGDYLLRVRGSGNGHYSLVVARSLSLDLPQATADAPVDISATHQAIGDLGLGGTGGGGLRGSVRVAVLGGTSAFLAALNDSTLGQISATAVVGNQLDTLDELRAFDVVIIGNQFYQNQFSQFDAVLRSWVETGGGIIATGWTVYGAGSATAPVRPDIDAIVPVNTSGNYNYTQGAQAVIIDANHPITNGASNFTMPSNSIWSEYPVNGIDPGASVLVTIGGNPGVVVGQAGQGRGVYFGPTLSEWSGTPTGSLDRLIEQAVLWAGGDRSDDYLVSARAGDTLTITTGTPGDGPDQPVNTLDPVLELLDAAGNLVAQDNDGAADGRNARLTTTVASDGIYRVRVRVSGGGGAYVLDVQGATGTPLLTAPSVTAVTPASGTVLNTAPQAITFQLSKGVRADSVSVDDLVLDSGGTVTAVRLLAGNQVQFDVSIPLVEGPFSYHLAAGAFTGLQGAPSTAFAAGFVFDLGGAFVNASAPSADATAPLNTWTFSFNEAINPASVSTADVAVFTGPAGEDLRGQITGVSASGSTLTVTFFDQFAPGNYHIEIGPNLLDAAGNPMDQDRDGSTGESLEDRFVADTVLRSPDLVPLSISVPESAVFGSPISVSWTVRNSGTDAARTGWYDRVTLTNGSTSYGLGDFFVQPNPLVADTSYTQTRQITLPLDISLPAGTWRLEVLVDIYGQQGEADNGNNKLVSGDFTLTIPLLPDLTVSQVEAPAVIEAGKPVTITWTSTNIGAATAAGGWWDTIFLSSDAQLGNDVYLTDVRNNTGLAAGASLDRSAQVAIPTNLTGNWYVVVRSDYYGAVQELSAEGNNHRFTTNPVSVIVPTEDLVVSSVTAAPSGTFGQTLNVQWTVSNQGTGPTLANWNDRVWLSRDGTLGSDDLSLGTYSASGGTPLAVGASYNRSVDVSLPLVAALGSGDYRILVQTDAFANEPETNESNNNRASDTVALALPPLADLTVSGVSVPAGLRSGDSVDVTFTLSNQGSAPASDFRYRMSLNDTADLNSENVDLGTFRFNDTLSAGESVLVTQRVTLPIGSPGTWYLGVLADSQGQIYEHDREGNNGALSPLLNVPLPPLVDLQVTDIVAPLDALAGQQVPISWTVRNSGTAAIVGGVFTDSVYLSTDGGVSLGVWVGDFTYEGDLAAGASLQRSQTITLPANVAARYTVVVFTDNSNNHYEAGGEFNNRFTDNTRIATTLPPLPNLLVASITPPSDVFSSTQTEVSWVVRNTGTGATSAPTWYDEVHLSLNEVYGDGDDVVLGTVANPSYLDVGDSYVGHLTFTVPRGLAGDYRLLVRTDAYGHVFEDTAEGDNTTTSALVHVSLTPPPDLQVQAVQAPTQAFSGQPMALSWTVVNAGDGRTLETAWYDRVYVSTDDQYDAGDTLLGQFFHNNALNPGIGYTQNQQVTLPIGQAGPRWFFVVTDAFNGVYEHVHENNNNGLDATPTQVVLTPPPDLEVEAFTAPATVRAGATANLSFTVRNYGATQTAESDWFDNVYLSRDGVLDAGDVLLGGLYHRGVLAPDAAYTGNLAVLVPNTLEGEYRLLVRTDAGNQVFEGFAGNGIDPEANNLFVAPSAITVQLRPADLVVEGVTAPAAAEAGHQITVTWSDRNQGTGSVQAASWTDRVMLSSDNIFGDDDDIVLGTVAEDFALAPGATAPQSLQITLPFSLATGAYTLYVQTDVGNQVAEVGGEGNNLSTGLALAVTRRTPDLVVSNPTLALPSTADGRMTVGWRVDNVGANRTNSTFWTDSVYLSRDSVLGSGDLLVGTLFRGNPLEVGEGYTANADFALPAGLGSGDYFLIVRTDLYDQVTEGVGGEANNTTVLVNSQSVPVPIVVPPQIVPTPAQTDLKLVSVDAAATAVSGQALSVTWTVTNLGTDGTGARNWYDAVYLSRDLVFDRSTDLYLGYRDHAGGLAAGESYDATASFNVPLGQSGPFYVFVATDRGGVVAETAEGNNIGVDSGFTQVSLAPPADLVVGDITIPDSGIPGTNASLTYTVTNQGSNPAQGSWRDTLYLSADTTWDIGDAVFGSVQVHGPLDGGTSYTRTITAALPGVTPGAYHVIVRSDILNTVVESNNGNNIGGSLDDVQIDVAQLALGTAVNGSLGAGQSLFYKIVVGAGETVRVKLDGAGNDNGNELYLRRGSMPTRGQFDAAGKEPFAPDQVAIIPTTEAGTYYLMLYGASGGAQAFSLLAESLPFSLQAADAASVGDGGPVTLRIDGARFGDGTAFHLVNAAGARIDASRVLVVSGSEAYVTFDARGAALGTYTLGAQDARGDSATLATPITVIAGTVDEIVVRFDGPAQVRPDRVILANVVYANEGNVDALAPLLIVSSPTGTEFGSTADSIGLSSDVQLLGLAPGGARDTLRPGDENSLPLLFKSVNAPMRFTVKSYGASNAEAIDFDLLKRSLRMPGMTDSDWEIRWANQLQPRLGGTWGDYVRLVNTLSNRFSTPERAVTDVRELFALAFTENAGFVASLNQSGRVLDGASGAAVGDAAVTAYRIEGDRQIRAATARTDAQGNYTLKMLQAGSYVLAIQRTVDNGDGTTSYASSYFFDMNRNGIEDAKGPGFTLLAGQDGNSGAVYIGNADTQPAPVTVNDSSPALATDAAGRTHMVWMRDGQIWHAVNAGAGWVNAAPLPEGAAGGALQLLIDPKLIDNSGEGLLVAWRAGEGNDAEIMYAVGQRLPDGSYHWSVPAKLTDNTQLDGSYALGVDANGDPVLLSQRSDASFADDSDIYASDLSIDNPQWALNAQQQIDAFNAWLASQTDEELAAQGIVRVAKQAEDTSLDISAGNFRYRYGERLGKGFPIIGKMEGEFRIDLQGQIDCELILRGNGALRWKVGDNVEIEGRAGGDVRYSTNKDTCAYEFKSARVTGGFSGAYNFNLTSLPIPSLYPLFALIDVFGPKGRAGRGEVGGSLSAIWNAGSDFPSRPDEVTGSVRGSAGINLEFGVPFTSDKWTLRALLNIRGKVEFKNGISLQWGDPPVSISLLARKTFGSLFPSGPNPYVHFQEFTWTYPGSGAGSDPTSIDVMSLAQMLAQADGTDLQVTWGVAEAPASGSLNDYTDTGESRLTYNTSDESQPVIAKDAAGGLWAGWSGTDGVLVTSRSDGSWGTPEAIPGSSGYANGHLSLGFDGLGNGLAVWNRLDTSTLSATSTPEQIQAVYENGGDLVFSRRDVSTGAWSTPELLLARAGDDTATTLQRLANGDLQLAWIGSSPTPQTATATTLYAARWSAAGGNWTAPLAVTSGTLGADVRVGEIAGVATLMWSQSTGPSNTVLRTAAWTGSAWSAATDVSVVLAPAQAQLAALEAASQLAASNDSLFTSALGLPSPPDDCCDEDDDPPPYDPQPVVPRDPNDILGPDGFGDQHWIAAGDSFGYTIRFENAADAAAPAQEVVVTQQLDADLDWRSFRVDDFGFGDQRIQLDGKGAFYSQRLDYSASRGYMLDVSAAIDVSTGIVTWKLSTIDPATGEVPTDAQLGFLPPNKDAEGNKDGRGEGFLSYTVKAKRNLPTGTVIDAEARIVFDTEEPIDTPAIFHTLDAGKPTSSVEALPADTEDPDFTVRWTGADAEGGSAIASYTVYVSTDGGDWEAWLTDTTLTEAIYEGEPGRRHAFYSVARDNAGNVEAAPDEPDAVTTVSPGKGTITGSVYDDGDGDGQRDSGEAGLAGRTVFLDSNDNGNLDEGERQTTTDGTGAYVFDNVVAGNWVVGQVQASGWIGTAPSSGRQPVTVTPDTSTDAVDFGSFLPGVAGGLVFDDLNANGQRDDGEALRGGVTVQLDRNADGSIDASTVSLDDGSWQLGGLLAGSYRISSPLGDNRLSTAPSGGSFSVAVTSGASRSGLDFGSVTAATLSGTAYDDTDGDGQRDAGEAGLAGWTIFLDADSDGLLDDGERRTTSAADGSWTIGALLPGSHTVAQVPQPGWLLTAPGLANPIGNTTASGSLQHTGSDQTLQLPDAGLVDTSGVAGYPSLGNNRAAQQLIGLDALRADSRFSGLDGSGLSVVVIDTGLDLDNSFFGPDGNGDGIADRIVYQYDFADDDTDASDRNGHGSNIGSLIGAADGVYGGAYTGIAPGADLIALKVFRDDGRGLFSYLENALRWVVLHADAFNVGVVNLSLGDGGNWNAAIARFGLGDELAALAARNIIVTAAAGNNFAQFGGAWGVAYPAADPAVLAVGATWSADAGGPWAFGSGATDYTTGADRVTSFSQRDDALLDVVAPGTGLAGANASGGISTLQGTSQASAMVAGVATLAQDLALQTLGRRLSLAEFSQLLSATSVHIVDGDDENDNVRNSGLGFQRVDVQALAEAILALSAGSGSNGGGSSGGDDGSAGGGTAPGSAAPATHSVTVVAGQTVGGLDFGNFRLARIDGLVYEDADSDGTQDAGEGGLAGFTVYLDSNNSASFDAGEASTVTDANGRWQFSDQGPGTVSVRVAPREGWRLLADMQSLTVTSGAQLNTALTANALPMLDALADVDIAEGGTVTVQATGHDHAGDRLQYSLVGSLPAGASIDADTGVFSFLAADGAANWQFTVRVTDSAGSAVERSFGVQVQDVAPTLSVTGPATAEDGQDYVLDLAASDPGQDTISQWTIDWGDGIVQTLAGNPQQAVHRYAQPGSYTVSASATDEDGTHTATGPTVQVSATVLQVSSFTATDTGFVVRFNRSIDPGKLNLTTAADNPMGASDIVFTDAAGKVVPGSVVVDADRRGITFVRSGGLLAAGRYELRLVSGAQAFVDATGALLDGNRDGTRGDAYVNSFNVSAGGAVLAIGDLARGPGQDINLPVGSAGLPITLSNAAGATQVVFTLRFDAALIGFVGAASGAGLPAGSTLSVDLSVAGQVRVEITTTAPLGAGTLELVRLQAGVQTAAPYGAAEVLDLTDISINGGAIAARGDDGVHVVAYLGDVDGNRAYTLQDVTRLQRLITKADSGFGAFPLIDPLLLGDVNASGTLTSLDAARLQQQAGGTSRPEFPPIPASGTGFLDQFFPVQPSLGTARVDLSQGLQPAGSTSGTGTAGTSSWISQWLAPAQGGNVAVKVKAGSSLIKLAPRL